MARHIARLGERLEARAARLARAEGRLTRDARAQLEALARTLATLGPESVLARGFVLVRDEKGTVLTRAATARQAAALELEFADGRVRARPERRAARRPEPKPEQGRLL